MTLDKMTRFKPRTIRSFVRRIGRMSYRQEQALTDLWAQYGLVHDQGLLDFSAAFGRRAPCVLEIGFGMGHSLAQQALEHPEVNFLGIEVHKPGIGNLLSSIADSHLTNVRIINADAVETLEIGIANESLDAAQIFFPDPWPKRRHVKRRLIQEPFVKLLSQKLKTEGQLLLATDWEDYAQQMMKVLSANLELENLAGQNQFSTRLAARAVTKFEQRGHQLGHKVWDLGFKKVEFIPAEQIII